jgi:hypothetical protein
MVKSNGAAIVVASNFSRVAPDRVNDCVKIQSSSMKMKGLAAVCRSDFGAVGSEWKNVTRLCWLAGPSNNESLQMGGSELVLRDRPEWWREAVPTASSTLGQRRAHWDPQTER